MEWPIKNKPLGSDPEINVKVTPVALVTGKGISRDVSPSNVPNEYPEISVHTDSDMLLLV